MYNHLKSHHPESYEKVRPTTAINQASKSNSQSQFQQRTITGMFAAGTKYKRSDDRYKAITKQITFLCETMTPIHIVNEPSWKKLLQSLDKRYECPERTFFTYTAIPALYNQVRERLQNELIEAQAYGLTMDAWSSITTEPFLVITIHFIDKQFNLKARVLQCVYVPEDHTGVNIAQRVTEVLEDFSLDKGRVVAVTTDSSSNMLVALRELEKIRLSCFGHVLHNAVGAAVKDKRITRAAAVCRKVVSSFRFSFKKSRAFTRIQASLKLEPKKLKSDVSTRWGSLYKMIESIHTNHKAIQELFSQGEFYN